MVGLRMPRALEALDATLARFEQGDSSMLEVLETLLGEEFTTRETRRIKMALQTARLGTIKTLAGYDFASSQASTGIASWHSHNWTLLNDVRPCTSSDRLELANRTSA